MNFRFSLASLLGELTLVALVIGLLRQTVHSWENRVMAPALIVSSLLMFLAALANLRSMFGRKVVAVSPRFGGR
jgi:hypothetical protein